MSLESGPKKESAQVIDLAQWKAAHPRPEHAEHLDPDTALAGLNRYVEKQKLLTKVTGDFSVLYDEVKRRIAAGDMRSPDETWLKRDIAILCEQAEYIYNNAETTPVDIFNLMRDLLDQLDADQAGA